MNTIVTQDEKIRAVLKQALEESLREVLPDLIERATRKKWLTREEVKELTGWSDRTLQHLRDSRQIPFSQHGRKIVYPTKGILSFLEQHRVRPKSNSWDADNRS